MQGIAQYMIRDLAKQVGYVCILAHTSLDDATQHPPHNHTTTAGCASFQTTATPPPPATLASPGVSHDLLCRLVPQCRHTDKQHALLRKSSK